MTKKYINSLNMQENNAIYPGMMLNIDQENFRFLVEKALKKLCRTPGTVEMIGLRGPGYTYSDFVVTISCSRNRKDCEVYRNRDGVLVFAERDGKVTAMDREYVFVDSHLRKKLGIADG